MSLFGIFDSQKSQTYFIRSRISFADSLFPVGIPISDRQQMICQIFDKKSQLGGVIGGNTVYYATLYDTIKRMPMVSSVRTESVGDNTWPAVPYMIEQGMWQWCSCVHWDKKQRLILGCIPISQAGDLSQIKQNVFKYIHVYKQKITINYVSFSFKYVFF